MNVINMKTVTTDPAIQDESPAMFKALTNLEDCVSRATGLMDLLSFTVIQDRSANGPPSRVASCGIEMLSEFHSDALRDAFEKVHEIATKKPSQPKKDGGSHRKSA